MPWADDLMWKSTRVTRKLQEFWMRRPLRGPIACVVLFVASGLTLGCGSDSDSESDAGAAEVGKSTADATESASTESATTESGATETGASSSDTETKGEAELSESPLLNPRAAVMNETAPAEFTVRFTTTAGEFTIVAHRDWSPNGADRFYNLVRNGFYDGTRFFRVLDGFMAQFGIPGDPQVAAAWRNASIPDDPVRESNTRGRVTFAKAAQPNSRTSQLFINFVNNSPLDEQGFAPVGEVIDGMDVVDRLYSAYGEGAPRGGGPDQGRVQTEGNADLDADFPELDYVLEARIVTDGGN
jgi:peptidyl-prolyl cis-trans isomerase A (cyclophilin A)